MDVRINHKEVWVPKNWCFPIWVLEKTPESPLDSKEIKSVNPEGNQSWIFTGRTDAEALILWPSDAKSWLSGKILMLGKIESKRKSGQQRIRWLYSITDSMDMNISKFQEIVEERGAWHVAVPGVTKSQIWLSDWSTTAVHDSEHLFMGQLQSIGHPWRNIHFDLWSIFFVGCMYFWWVARAVYMVWRCIPCGYVQLEFFFFFFFGFWGLSLSFI